MGKGVAAKKVAKLVRSLPNRHGIEIVVRDGDIPLEKGFRDALPKGQNLTFINDERHVLEQCRMKANKALKASQAEQKGRKQNPRRQLQVFNSRPFELSRSDRRFLKRMKKDSTVDLLHDFKEMPHSMYQCKDRAKAEAIYAEMKELVRKAPPPVRRELRKAINYIEKRRESIFNYFGDRYTTAAAEAYNGIAKNINRNGRGYPKNLAFRVLAACENWTPEQFALCTVRKSRPGRRSRNRRANLSRRARRHPRQARKHHGRARR